MKLFLEREPSAEKFLHPFIGSEEFINGGERWILNLHNAAPEELRAMPWVMERVAAVKKMRLESRSLPTRKLAETPSRYHVTVIPNRPFLVIPEVSSERRAYVPIGWLEPPIIPSNLVRVLVDADLWHFGVLTSAMHMAWLRQIGGRLKSDYRYSIGIVYNTFPWPDATDEQRDRIRTLAQTVLDVRKEFPNSTLADLYDVDVMPHQLRKAHQDLDRAIDRLYLSSRKTVSNASVAPVAFIGDRDRVEHLFSLYERLITPLAATTKQPKRRKSTKRI